MPRADPVEETWWPHEPAPAACVGIMTGLTVEAGCLPKPEDMPPGVARPLVRCSGADPVRAQAGALQLIADGATALVSFGLAAGLAPVVRPGEVVVADAVVTPEGEKLPTDPAWRQRLVDYLGGQGEGCRTLRVAGSDEILGAGWQKQRLFQATGAGAADMESHAVAMVARQMGVPFLIVRAVADPVEASLPLAAFAAVKPNGGTDYLGLVGQLLLRPWELPAFVQLVQDSRLALAALRRAAAAGSPLLVAP